AFLHVEGLSTDVAESHYDLVGPKGGIILPRVWETVIEPGWPVSMHMWPGIPGPLSGHYFRLQSRHDGKVGRSPPPGPPPTTMREPSPPLPAGWPARSTPIREIHLSSTTPLISPCSPTSSEMNSHDFGMAPT
ncbi:uncharacterized protein K444DRAFT_700210, partial [Hyaloscypha bicolor E]